MIFANEQNVGVLRKHYFAPFITQVQYMQTNAFRKKVQLITIQNLVSPVLTNLFFCSILSVYHPMDTASSVTSTTSSRASFKRGTSSWSGVYIFFVTCLFHEVVEVIL